MNNAFQRGLRVCLSAGAVGLMVAAADELGHVNATAVALVLVLAVVCLALAFGWLEALIGAIVASLGLDYFFIPPRGFGIEQPEHWVVLLVFLATAIAAGQLAARADRQRAQAIQRQAELEKLYRLAEAIPAAGNADIVPSLVEPLRDR